MGMVRRLIIIGLILAVIGCAAPAPTPTARPAEAVPAAQPAAPRRITIVIKGSPASVSKRVITGGSGSVPGHSELEVLVHRGLSIVNGKGGLSPQLAEAVPSIENGLWKVAADGRMETTWRIRADATWHDGTPLTAEDLAFTTTVEQDRDANLLRESAYDLVESVEVVDPRTITVRWKEPYIQADMMFTDFALPLPRHLLLKTYLENKGGLSDLPYWSTEFIGTGPYQVREWVRDSHVTLAANQAFAPGRPQVDQITVRFIPDNNALTATVLAGGVDLTMGRGLSVEEGLQIQGQWREGKMDVRFGNWIMMYPQFINPNPAQLSEVSFRRALLHGLDRQQLVDSLQAGLVPVAHSWLSPSRPEHAEVDPSIVKYQYDPTRAAQLLEGLGLRKGADGGLRDPAGQPINLEIRTTGSDDIHLKAMTSVADYWRRLGFTVDEVVIPPQRASDREYRATFPSLILGRQLNGVQDLSWFHSREIPAAENRFAGKNSARYRSAELDGLIDRYYSTIPMRERTQTLGRVLNHMTENVTNMGLFYGTAATMVANRLQGAAAAADGSTESWNAEAWDLK
jgi:peptide/nickel transport system substrate-binding protein